MPLKREMTSERGVSEPTRIKFVGSIENKENYIQPVKSLEDLSRELSEKYKKSVVVVDVLEENVNKRTIHSLITGETFDEFLNDYKFNTPEFSEIMVKTIRAINPSHTHFNKYNISFVFKEK